MISADAEANADFSIAIGQSSPPNFPTKATNYSTIALGYFTRAEASISNAIGHWFVKGRVYVLIICI